MKYGRYQVIKEVGRGSMGVVFQASDPQIDRMVAVKVLHQGRLDDENITKRFLKEAMVIGRLAHPNIVSIFDVGEEQGAVYIAMEFLEGESLSDFIKQHQPDSDKIVAFGIQIAEALDYAHHKGVVHRDIKPANIVVQPDGRIKINDFGIAHIDDSTATLQTQVGDIMGTPSYMSPEQVLGKIVDGRSDLFSLGAVLYELSTGKRAFGGEGKNLATVFNEIIHITPLEPVNAASIVPAGLSEIIMKALEKEPDKRFQTGRELAEALKGCLKVHEPLAEEAQGPEKKKPRFGIISGVIWGMAAIAGGFIYYSQQGGTSPSTTSIKAEPVQSVSQQLQPPLPSAAGPAQPGSGSDSRSDRNLTNTGNVSLPKSPLTNQSAGKHESVPENNEPIHPSVASKPLPKFAFLKVSTVPKGAHVYIDGTLKGTTPLILKLNLGSFQVRISHAGYRDIEKKVTLDKMKDYPVKERLIPLK